MGIKNTRMSRTNHPIPRMANIQYDLSGLRGTAYRDGTVLREAKDPPAAPVKERPKNITTSKTPPPMSYARTIGHEGHIRGRQADKSSKSPTK